MGKDFKEALQGKRIPICVLDQKWHRLFAVQGKPEDVLEKEKELNLLLQRQGKLNQDLKDLKKLKSKLMSNIMDNMEGTHAENQGRISSKKLDEDSRLIEEVNEKMEQTEDELLDVPHEIDRANGELMLLTVEYCYNKMRLNVKEAKEITDWITQVRIDLKKNIIKKQNREINSRQIYSYMHDIFGAEMMDVFDLQNDDADLMNMLETPKRKPPLTDGSVVVKDDTKQQAENKENFDTGKN